MALSNWKSKIVCITFFNKKKIKKLNEQKIIYSNCETVISHYNRTIKISNNLFYDKLSPPHFLLELMAPSWRISATNTCTQLLKFAHEFTFSFADLMEQWKLG